MPPSRRKQSCHCCRACPAAATMHSNAVMLEHPSGAKVMLLGTQHVSASHGSPAHAVDRLRPSIVLLELDQARFQQVDFRLRYLMHADTASLMDLAADSSSTETSLLQRLLPDALLWGCHMQQFALQRNEGVPLLLGSLYGADFLQAALAASALPQQASLVLADQPQHITRARFMALTDTFAGLRRLLGGLVSTVHAEAYPSAPQQQQHDPSWATSLPAPTSNSNSSSSTTDPPNPPHTLQQLRSIAAASAQLAAGRLVHLFLEWWAMALTSQARWWGNNVHPVFLLVGDPALQQQLAAKGCEGVAEAAAAAGRLLELATAAAAGGSGSCGSSLLPAVEDLQAIRRFVTSLESVMWAANSSSGAGSADAVHSSSSSSGSQIKHWLQDDSNTAAAAAAGVEGIGELLPLRPWWVTLSGGFSNRLAQMTNPASSSAAAAAGAGQGCSLSSALQQHQHANVTAAAAYDRAVMAERNRVLVTAMWRHAAAAQAEASAAAAAGAAGGGVALQQQQQGERAAVVAVVGYNHVPGIVDLWRQLQQQHDHWLAAGVASADGATTSSSCGSLAGFPTASSSSSSTEDVFLPWQVTLTDAAASVLELAAAGGAGLAYWLGVNRVCRPASAAASAAASSSSSSSGRAGFARVAAGSGGGLRRLGLLLLPAAVALLPLQRDVKRLQEAGGLLSHVAVVNDVILCQEAEQLTHQQQQQQPQWRQPGGVDAWQGAGSRIMQLARKAQAATAGAAAPM